MVCGRENAVGHHPDYAKPLDVIWLCKIHHRERHYTTPDSRRLVEAKTKEAVKRIKKEIAEKKRRTLVLKKLLERRRENYYKMLESFRGRNLSIIKRTQGGETMASVGRNYGLSRERIRQIVGREKEGV